MNGSASDRLRAEEAKLHRRIESLCRPKGLLGHLALVSRRRRLIRELKARFEVPYAMFLTQGIVSGRPTEERRIAELAASRNGA